MNYDIVIIGSGLGGLLCGYILSKEGYSVCIVEKNAVLGGCLQTFKKNGNVFDTGIHYVGSLDEGQTLHNYFEYFGLNDKLKIRRLDEKCFDKICFLNDGKEYSYSMGEENFISSMLEKFPNENKAVNNYMEKIKEVCDTFHLLNMSYNSTSRFYENKDVTENAYNYIQSITTDTRLQNVLAGINLLYAGVSTKSPMYVHSLINYSFIQSAYRFVDGSAQLATILAEKILSFGGVIIRNYQAEKFVFQESELKYLKSIDGQILEAKYFISNIHPYNTLQMLGKERVRKVYWQRVSAIANTTSAFVVYITFKEKTFPYYNYNFYLYRYDNVWNLDGNKNEDWPANIFCFTPAYSGESQYARSMILMTYMDFNEVNKWEKTTVGRRGEDYGEFKEKKTAHILDVLAQRFPNIKNCIKSVSASTPLTYRDYTGTIDGSIYGIMRDCNEPLKTYISHRTKIPNLFLTGQNTAMHGMIGVTMGAVITSSALVGMNELLNKIKKHSSKDE
jgi:all-trans-retinol 13,14-reductase